MYHCYKKQLLSLMLSSRKEAPGVIGQGLSPFSLSLAGASTGISPPQLVRISPTAMWTARSAWVVLDQRCIRVPSASTRSYGHGMVVIYCPSILSSSGESRKCIRVTVVTPGGGEVQRAVRSRR